MRRRPFFALFLLAASAGSIASPASAQLPSEGQPAMASEAAGEALWAQGKRAYRANNFPETARLLALLLSHSLAPTRRAETEQLLSLAEGQVGRLRISSNVVGTDILVDGRNIGQTPLPHAWYLNSGKHHLEARSPGLPSQKRDITAVAGSALPIEFILRRPGALATESLRAKQLIGTAQGQRAPSDRFDGAKTFHNVVLLTGGVLSLASLAAGIGWRVSSTNRAAEARQLRAELQSIPDPTGQPCSRNSQFVRECIRLDQLEINSFENQRTSEQALLAFSAIGSLTLLYGLYVAFSSDEPPSSTQRARLLPAGLTPNVVPLVGGAQLSITQAF